tara:strand:- start:5409 stop:6032 length:624 start_codon:yes stop_codon:yes gene_type:complete
MKRIFFLLAIILMASCSQKVFKEKWTKKKAPETFKARFETTQGNFEIIAKREWSPQGVDRLYQLIKYQFYNELAIYRVVPNFVAQFGIHNDSVVNKSWRKHPLDDEPVLQKNDSMTIAFARAGKKTRTAQLYINLKDNHRLDKISGRGVTGFPVVAKVTSGMENILKFYDKYTKLGRRQDSIHRYGNKFLKKNYPEVDYIKKAYIIK